MACSLSAMTAAAVQVGAMAAPPSSGLSFKDGLFLGTSSSRGLRSFGRPSPSLLLCRSSPVVAKAKPFVFAKAVDSSIGSSSSSSWDSGSWKQLLRPLVFNPLEGEDCKKNRKRRAGPGPIFATAAEGGGEELPEKLSKSIEDLPEKVSKSVEEAAEKAPVPDEGLLSKKGLTTGSFFFAWYFLNVIFNILNKKLYNYFPFPYFVSVVHLLVGVAYCLVSWSVGAPKRAPIDKDLWLLLTPVAVCHALGHIMTNVSFAAVAVSFTHTIKSLEPFFNAAASQFVLGEVIPVKLWLSLAPIVLGVSAASLTELSFNWTGFISAMTANVAFTYRNIYSKKAMTGMDSTNVYAYISILSLAFCIPPAIVVEGPALLQYGFSDAIAKVGTQKFLLDLFWVGMFYHLYNQLANNTLERVAPLTHAVGNVLKRVFVIGFSIIVFGNRITTQTGIGTVVAISGVAVYSVIKADIEEKKRAVKKAEEL